MRMLISSIVLLMLLAPPAVAGRNANGALVVHTDDTVQYRDGAYWCSTPTLPATCEELNAAAGRGIDEEQIIWVMAAFLPDASPAVTTVQFGIDHNIPADQGYFTNWRVCGPSPTESPDPGWPETGFGNIVTFGSPVHERLIRLYWFATFVDGPENYFATRSYPSTNQAKFFDDADPPNEDLCENFGVIRWFQPGHNDCPQIPPASVDDAPARISAVGPNPCVGRATFAVFLTASENVRVEILDLQGRRIATLADGTLPAGSHEVVWNAAGASSGIYLARLTSPAGVRSTKLILLD